MARWIPTTRLALAALAFLLLAGSAAAAPSEGRLWLYSNLTGLVGRHLALNLMPGIRYEFADSAADAGGIVMYELFAGPTLLLELGNMRLKLPLWYYYMGFPIRATGDFYSSHNVELIPSLDYSLGRWNFSSRSIFHNKLYADNPLFDRSGLRRGYSLLLRQMLRASYGLTDWLAVTVADELFIGLIEDGETAGIKKGEPFFERRGISMNRIHAGAVVTLAPGLSLTPEYVFESSHDPDRDLELTKMTHYLMVTAAYALRFH